MVISKSAFARRHGFSPSYVTKLVAEGVLTVRPDGRLDQEQADHDLDANRPHPLRIDA